MLLLTVDLFKICVLELQSQCLRERSCLCIMFYAIRICLPWAAGSALPVLVRKMQFSSAVSLTN